MRKVIGIAAIFMMTVFQAMPAWAATKISTVKIDIKMESFEETPELEIESKNNRYEVGEAEMISGIFSAAYGPGLEINTPETQKDATPVYEIELIADDDYYFGVMEQKDIKLSGIDAECTKAVRKDSGTTLVLTVHLTGIDNYIGAIDGTSFKNGIAAWEPAANAATYSVSVYKDGKRLGLLHETSGTKLDIKPLITEDGIYSFKVYPLSASGKKGKMVSSEAVSAAAETKMDNSDFVGGWVEEENGWRYQYTDGVYVQDNWIEDQGWYYFDGTGYMVRDTWKLWKKQWYYFGSDGKLLEDK